MSTGYCKLWITSELSQAGEHGVNTMTGGNCARMRTCDVLMFVWTVWMKLWWVVQQNRQWTWSDHCTTTCQCRAKKADNELSCMPVFCSVRTHNVHFVRVDAEEAPKPQRQPRERRRQGEL